jgi:hypothetical protein
MTAGDELARARAAARSYSEMHGFGDVSALAGPPVLGPVRLSREGRQVVAFRWFGAGRGQDYVQVEFDAETGDVTVSGARGHDAFPVWRPRREERSG